MTDTMAGGGRGGVGIRLYVSGGEVVKRTFDQVGDSGKKMWAEIALGQKAANPAIRALSLGVGEARSGVDGLAGRAGSASNVLGAFGAAGIAAAAGLGGLAIALGKAQDAMAAAAELTDTADRIGVGVEQLQRWNFVADEAGVSTSSFQANLEKLNGVLGAFKAGIGDGKLKPVFEELGITQEQLQNVQSADQLMLILADTLGQVKDRALQVKFARSLGVEDSLPILRLGADGIRNLSDEAEGLGLVMGKDVVQALDEADRKLEIAQQRIDTTVRLSVAGLADDFATLVGQIAGAIVQLSRWDAQLQRMTGAGQRRDRGLLGIASDAIRGRTAQEGEEARDRGAMNQNGFLTWLGVNAPRRAIIEAEQRRQSEMNDLAYGTGEYAPKAGGFDPQGHTVRSGGRGGRSPRASAADKAAREEERRVQEAARARETLDREEMSARRERTRLMWAGDTPRERAQLAKGLLALDIKERDAKRATLVAELERTGAIDQATQTNLDQLKLLDEQSDALAQRRILEDQRLELAEEQFAREIRSEEDAIALLDIQGQLARTAAERAEVARRILLAEQAIARRTLQNEVERDGLTSADDFGRLQRQQQRQQGEREVQFTLEQDRLNDQFRSAGREIVQAIEDGRIGDLIADRLKSRLLDMALDGLFDVFKGAGKGSGPGNAAMNFAASLFRPGGGRASGGDVRDGFAYGVAEHGPELLMLGNGHVTSAAETARMVRDLAGSGDGGPAHGVRPTVHEHHYRLDLRGAVMTDDLLKQMNAMAAQSETRAVARSVDTVRRGSASLQQRQRRLGAP